ncbi:hypothetical protein [Mycoplasma seminis]|uniref:Uncharacterized protein n=1 Tax=Mycoplasma seminis TaxID=512749 RepID=A0ABY9HAP9_9MOLU|nr:hypothetical protein [Mycoplasma seminis]WLP85660.1 hypothetical protein Q8852_00665 [Mycoplasma seminis]
MASKSDFKSLKSNISKIENKISSFDSKAEDIERTFNNLSIPNQYDVYTVASNFSNTASFYKNQCQEAMNACYDRIQEKMQKVESNIKHKSNNLLWYSFCLRKQLRSIHEFNEWFIKKDYMTLIRNANFMDEYYSTPDVIKYIKLLKLKSFEAICEEKMQAPIRYYDYWAFEDYYNNCKKYNSTYHILKAREWLFIATIHILQNNMLPGNENYKFHINALKTYQEFDEELKRKYLNDYENTYPQAVDVFNNRTKDLYEKFQYSQVKDIINDSKYFNVDDIEIEFFKSTELSPIKLFNYLEEFGNNGDLASRKQAQDDTIILLNGELKTQYIEYWIKNFDHNNWDFIQDIIKYQNNWFKISNILCPLISKNIDSIKNISDLFKHYAVGFKDYIETIKDEISIDKFMSCIIIQNEFVQKFYKKYNVVNKKDEINKLRKQLDGIAYGMIKGYHKLVSLYTAEKIAELNKVLSDASVRLYGKNKKYQITPAKKDGNLEKLKKKVKLITVSNLNKKKIIIWISVIAGLIWAGLLGTGIWAVLHFVLNWV